MLNLYITSCKKKDGKTFLSAGIAATMQSLGYKTSVYKPIQTAGIDIGGFMQSPDLTFIKSIDPYIETTFTYVLKDDSEPIAAAEKENKYIDINLILKDFTKINTMSECTIIDGDGGLLSPVAPNTQNSDIIKKHQTPILFTIKPDKNSVNDILLSLNTAEEKGLKVNGVVINNIDTKNSDSDLTSLIRIIEEYSNAKVLGLVPNLGDKIIPEELITGILNGIDIESIFNVKIEKLDFGQ